MLHAYKDKNSGAESQNRILAKRVNSAEYSLASRAVATETACRNKLAGRAARRSSRTVQYSKMMARLAQV